MGSHSQRSKGSRKGNGMEWVNPSSFRVVSSKLSGPWMRWACLVMVSGSRERLGVDKLGESWVERAWPFMIGGGGNKWIAGDVDESWMVPDSHWKGSNGSWNGFLRGMTSMSSESKDGESAFFGLRL